ncbi:uncharacterized protein PpBr36_10027 [Pyricularia pennisetigena]|uniref:uncharacterized protein n=1 Tax=Pyricularia pennisetigena TaxID=1578925 RepID=UPI00114EB77B|nr:uncharacterized protein PpBr36_10027 [Pyricularia pennisetigena]TLS22445.1 hypothetical protein PpBr36_10027 [Pyricularia pennisetigena]
MAESTSQTLAPVPTIPAGYTIRAGLPSAQTYRDLRSGAGIIPVTAEQAEAAVKGTWYGCHIVHTSASSSETIVGMGAVIANGSWYFHIVDVAILPEHQRKGLGKAVIHALMEYILANKAEGRPFICLSASVKGVSLYRKCAFMDGENFGETGMVWEGTYPEIVKEIREAEEARS